MYGIVSSLFMLFLLAGCLAKSQQSDECNLVFDTGVIKRIEQVTIDRSQSGIGSFASDSLYEMSGSAANGATMGSIAGSAKEKEVATGPGIELTIDLESGKVVIVAHERSEENSLYRAGDRVHFMIDCRGTMWVWPDF